MLEFLPKGSHVFFPPDGPADRFQYFYNLTIEHGEHVRYATCVLCSVTVHGIVHEQVAALWGDVTVESDGSVAKEIEIVGGGLTVLPGGRIDTPPISAVDSPVKTYQKVWLYGNVVVSGSSFYYPGQRSFPARGVSLFIEVVLLMLICGGWLAPATFRERMAAAVRQPIWSAVFGSVLIAFIPIFIRIMLSLAFLLYLFPRLFFVLFYGGLIVYWLLLTIGLASLSLQVGSFVGASSLAKYVTGALVIIVAMLIPVLGFFVMAAVLALALGAGARASLPSLKRHAV